MSDAHRNRLADEPSLYLQQHASNPVDWYPWGDEALDRAIEENKPILLSVGYSACHWCHVMEHESFENPQIAELMNENFVCIKVDREERPDVDHLYMKAVQAMTGHGGWPMTVFLAPDLKPFWAGTYFPPTPRGKMPGFPQVLLGVSRAFHEKPAEISETGDKIAEFLARGRDERAPVTLDDEAVATVADGLAGMMDAEWGGFGKAPKFPGSLCLSFLFGAETSAPSESRRALVKTALDRMAAGGVHDQLGGGFHRYSVDRTWLVPHFEKMLYDQALLLAVYGEAAAFFDDPRYGYVAQGIMGYVLREMTPPEGGFYSTQDADSEGVEGKFFVWTPAEVADAVGVADAKLICAFYDVTEEGNFEGTSILHPVKTLAQTAAEFRCTRDEVVAVLERSRPLMLAARSQRVAPGRDEKILADWNGLMIAALALVGRSLDVPKAVHAAERAADFVRRHMTDDNGDLLHFHADGHSRVSAFLDDYAFFGRGCLEVFLATGRPEDLRSAEACAEALIERFADPDRGGFAFSAADGASLLARTNDLFDGAVPSGNSVATELLLRLGDLTGNETLAQAGRRALEALLPEALANGYGGAHLLCVADRDRSGWPTVVIVGGDDSTATAMLERASFSRHIPGMAVMTVGPGAADATLPTLAQGKTALGGKATAYVCRRGVCLEPASSAEELLSRLDEVV